MEKSRTCFFDAKYKYSQIEHTIPIHVEMNKMWTYSQSIACQASHLRIFQKVDTLKRWKPAFFILFVVVDFLDATWGFRVLGLWCLGRCLAIREVWEVHYHCENKLPDSKDLGDALSASIPPQLWLRCWDQISSSCQSLWKRQPSFAIRLGACQPCDSKHLVRKANMLMIYLVSSSSGA